jgi:SAM-dependent methyltransferase
MSTVYHHLSDPTRVARECHRVLRKGGYICIRNSTRESDFPHRHFFPALEAPIASDLPALGTSSRPSFWAAFLRSCTEL